MNFLPKVVLALFVAFLSPNPIHSQTLLNREQAGPLLPATVFYRGQVAPVQQRNSAGVRFPDSKLILAAIVDNSGYATAIKEKYQAYLITEVALTLGAKSIPPGAYGFGFITGERVVVMDLGGNELLNEPTHLDPKLPRPNPLQMLPDPSAPTRYRLYVGRSFITVEPAQK